MKTKSEFWRRLTKLFSPKPFLKYTLESMQRHKWLIIVGVLFLCCPVVFADKGIDLSWGDPTKNFTFIGSMEHITIDLDDTLGGYAGNVYNVVLPIGQSLAIMYWLISFGEIMMRSDLTPEHIALQFLKIGGFLVALSYGWDILRALFTFFNESFAIVTDTLGTMPTSPDDTGVTFDGLKAIPWYEVIPYVLEFGAWVLFRSFCCIVTSLIVWTRKLKLLLMVALAPIGVSDYLGGTKSSCFRFIKKLIALGLQGLIMYIIGYLSCLLIFDALANSGLSGDYVAGVKNDTISSFSFLIACIPCALAMLAAFNKSEELANTIIGAN